MSRFTAFERLIAALFPATCVLCGAPGVRGQDLCAGCDAELPRNRNACAHCGAPFAGAVPAGTRCGRCQRQPPSFAHCVSAFRYAAAVPSLVLDAKFRGRLNVLRLLGECLADRVQESGLALPEVLIPVPLHPARLRWRGYNQSLEIARTAGRALKLPVAAHACARIAETLPQIQLATAARRRNVVGAFVTKYPPPWSHVAIVDDVMTTGSTVGELSRVFVRAGVTQVDIWVVARTAS